jgi:hypothetical protein
VAVTKLKKKERKARIRAKASVRASRVSILKDDSEGVEPCKEDLSEERVDLFQTQSKPSQSLSQATPRIKR